MYGRQYSSRHSLAARPGGLMRTPIHHPVMPSLRLFTNMAGSVPDAADVVVSDPVEAGVMAVMLIADTAKFSIDLVRGRRF